MSRILLLGGEASLASNQRELRAQGRHLIALLLAECVRGDDLERVAPGGADERQRRARAAARVLDHGVPGLQSTVLLRARDHGARHPVLHAAGGILPLELREDVRAPGWNDLSQSNQRGVSDRIENVDGLDGPLSRS